MPVLNKKMWADDQKTNIFRVFGSFLHYREWRPGRNLDRIPRTFSDDDYFKDALTNGGGTLVTFYTRLHKGKKADSFIVFENGKPMDFKTANQRGIKEIVEYVKKSVALNIKDDTN